jgi:acyl-CoA thioester hydrolase
VPYPHFARSTPGARERAGGTPAVTEHRSFSWPVRVYYEDTDAAGVVYYANYLRYFERARTEWLRSLGFEQPALAADHRVVFVVRSLAVKYRRPARFNDALAITVEAAEIGASRMALHQLARRDDEELVDAQVDIACVNTATFKPVRIPAPVHAAVLAVRQQPSGATRNKPGGRT